MVGERTKWACTGVRVRTTLATTLIVGLTLVLGALAILILLRRGLVNNLDEVGENRVRDIAGLVAEERLTRPVADAGQRESLVQVVDRDGWVVASSANVRVDPPLATFRPTAPRTEYRTVRLSLPGAAVGQQFRVAAREASSPAGPVTVYVATSLEDVDDILDLVRVGFVVGVPLVLVVVAGASWLLTGRALRPVEEIRTTVEDISESSFGRRVPVPRSGDEIGRLADTMNAMLDRLDASTERQRRFVADASHELQAPLSSLRVELEIALAHPEATDWRRTAGALLQTSGGMERLVQNLLYLARSDGALRPGAPVLVDLDTILLGEAHRLRGNGIVLVDTGRVSAATVVGRPDDLRRAVRNLLDNAERFARSAITLELFGTDQEVHMTVGDDGPGVPPPDRRRVFDRFTQLDESRTRAGQGSGLGLAIVRDIVQSHGGTVAIVEGPGARFLVRLPAG